MHKSSKDSHGFLRLLSLGALIAMALALFSCKGFFTSPVLTSMTVSPASPSVAVGANQQFTVAGVNDDGSSATVKAAWTSGTPATATFTNDSNSNTNTTGMANAVAVGTSTITATSTGTPTVTATTTMTVTASALQSITVTDNGTLMIIRGISTDQLKATGRYADSSTADLTSSVQWSSSLAGVTISSGGVVSAPLTAASGIATITAKSGNATPGTITITVQ